MGSALLVSQQELGELAGLSRQRTNAAIKALEEANLVHANYGSLLIQDLQALRNFADGGLSGDARSVSCERSMVRVVSPGDLALLTSRRCNWPKNFSACSPTWLPWLAHCSGARPILSAPDAVHRDAGNVVRP
jgi:Crp-like helix-turn-helix protein